MKRLILPLIFCAAMVCGIFGGVSLLTVHADALETAKGVNYVYLSNPVSITSVDSTYVNVVNKEDNGSYTLYKFPKSNPTSYAPPTNYSDTVSDTTFSSLGGYTTVRTKVSPLPVFEIKDNSSTLIFTATVNNILPGANNIATRPNFMAYVSATEIYVIDRDTCGIDIYKMSGDTLVFDRVFVAQMGTSGGYHYSPMAIQCIDESRYVVSDLSGVKLIDMSKSGSQVFYFPVNTETGDLCSITNISFDLWQGIYLTRSDSTIFHFEISSNDAISYAGKATELPQSVINAQETAQTDALGRTLTADIYPNLPTSAPAKWSLCRSIGKIYYIDDHNAVRSFVLDNYRKPSDFDHYKWQDNMMKYNDVQDGLFMELMPDTILFNYPNAIDPAMKISQSGIKVQVLAAASFMYDKTTGVKVNADNYSYVLYGGYAYYVDKNNLKDTVFSTADPQNIKFDAQNTGKVTYDGESIFWLGYAARVLLNGVPIYSYPMYSDNTETTKSITIGHINRNYALTDLTNVPGLRINRRITFPSNNRFFYEIRVDANGMPPKTLPVDPETHEPTLAAIEEYKNTYCYVGYIDTEYVMDSYGSVPRQSFSPDAHIVINNAMQTAGGLVVYATSSGDDSDKTYDLLKNNEQIKVVGKLDKSAEYTQVLYFRLGQAVAGWVRTENIVMNGITAWQIVSIIVLVTCAVTGVSIFVGFAVKRKKRNI